METFEQRMESLVKSVAGNANKFALSLGAERANMIYKVLKGETLPSLETIFRIKKVYPDINLEWLLNGNGNMFVQNHDENKQVNESQKENLALNQSLYEKIIQEKEKVIAELREDKEFLKGIVLKELRNMGKLKGNLISPSNEVFLAS